MSPKLISIVGRSGSGKTELVTKLISYFVTKGLKVGSIKHTHHNVQFDQKGKDSWKHRSAGSTQVLLMTDNQMAVFSDLNEPKSLTEISRKWFDGFDLVISEGFKNEPCLKLEVYRAQNQKTPLFTNPNFNIQAIATDSAIKSDLPVLDLNQILPIARWIESKLDL